jgi:hypothetical protein
MSNHFFSIIQQAAEMYDEFLVGIAQNPPPISPRAPTPEAPIQQTAPVSHRQAPLPVSRHQSSSDSSSSSSSEDDDETRGPATRRRQVRKAFEIVSLLTVQHCKLFLI